MANRYRTEDQSKWFGPTRIGGGPGDDIGKIIGKFIFDGPEGSPVAKLRKAHVEVASGDMTIGTIPLALFFVGERKGGMEVQPWSLGLAHTATEYYRSLARTAEVENLSGWPYLIAKGISKPSDGSTIELGPSTVLYAPGETADWKLIGPDAALVEQVAKGPERVLDAFSKLALEPIIPRSGVTASAHQIDNSRANSSIEAWAGSLADTLNLCLEFTSLWLGETPKRACWISASILGTFGCKMALRRRRR